MNRTNPRSLNVAVTISHRPNHEGETGGLAGTWERITKVAAGRDDLRLTVFFLGDREEVRDPAPGVRHVLLPSFIGTERFPCFSAIPTHTDLTPLHPALFKRLQGFDVIHTTDTFYGYALTALWRHRVSGTPLVTSMQTDAIGWARVYTPRILPKVVPSPALVDWLLNKAHLLDRQERSMEGDLTRFLRGCAAVFISHDRDRERVQRLSPGTRVQFLRRGLDLSKFNPDRKDRDKLLEKFKIPGDRKLLLHVGRIDPVKGAMIAAKVVKGLLERGENVHLLMVGEGSQRSEVAALLGDRVTLTGNLPHDDLGWVYASCDLLLFPSEAEVWPNVFMEARACGLPVIGCEQAAMHLFRGYPDSAVLLPDRDEHRWLEAAIKLLHHPEQLEIIAKNARAAIEAMSPTWEDILERDLMPVWRTAAGR